MSEFENLTKYLPLLDENAFGTWVINRENDGTIEPPIQMPFVNYAEVVHHFINDIYDFIDDNKDMDLTRYDDILDKSGLEWGSRAMSEADVSGLNTQCIMALLVCAVRAERFCNGALLGVLKDGSIRRWLERLKEIDEGEIM